MSGSPHTITALLTDAAEGEALEAVDGLGFDGYDPERADRTDDVHIQPHQRMRRMRLI